MGRLMRRRRQSLKGGGLMLGPTRINTEEINTEEINTEDWPESLALLVLVLLVLLVLVFGLPLPTMVIMKATFPRWWWCVR